MVADVQTSTKMSTPLKSILKKTKTDLTHTELWKCWSDNMSADQLIPIVKAVNLHLLLHTENKSIYQTYSDLHYNAYIESFIKNFYLDYKRGNIMLSLTNKLTLAELCRPNHKKKINQITFNPTVQICLLDTNSCRNLYCTIQSCDSKQCSRSITDEIKSMNHQVCFLCISKEESSLLIHKPS